MHPAAAWPPAMGGGSNGVQAPSMKAPSDSSRVAGGVVLNVVGGWRDRALALEIRYTRAVATLTSAPTAHGSLRLSVNSTARRPLRVMRMTSALLERLPFLVPDGFTADRLAEFANHSFRPSP